MSLAALSTLWPASARAEVIRSFDCALRLQKDTTLDVTETIVWDFEQSRKHGIYRDIPVRYKRNGGSYTIYLNLESVSDGKGRNWNYKTSRDGDDLHIRIGDADKLVTGVQTYVLHYKVRRAVNFFKDAAGKDAPEVYWNATGDRWQFVAKQVTARFYPPPGVNLDQIKTTCFVGPPGSTRSGSIQNRDDHVLFYTYDLSPGSGLTLVAGLPAGSVVKPSTLQSILWLFADWWPAFLVPILAALALGVLFLQGGRDVEGGLAVAVEWNPPTELTPAEVGTLVDEKCDMADIVSTLVDLAARGYMVIEQTETEKLLFFSSKDYVFTKRADAPPESVLLPHEREFLRGLFLGRERVTLSALKNKFYTHLPKIREDIYESLMSKNLFVSNPENKRGIYRGAAVGLAVIAGAAFFFGGVFGLAPWGIGFAFAAVLTFLCANAMPAKTATGSRLLRQCLGFQRYVSMAEKERIKVLADKDPTIFGRMLPYAMVLGVADQWADAFKDLMTEPPDWFIGPAYGVGFSSSMFVNDLGSGMNSMGSTLSSAPSSSGGSGGSGFSGGGSGGGFGGGGGGSW